MKKIILIAASSAFLCGCTWTVPHQIATSNTPLPSSYKVLGPASGKACETHLFNLFNIGGSARLQAAIDDALNKSGGDAMIEITTDYTVCYNLLYTQNCTLVNGLAIKR